MYNVDEVARTIGVPVKEWPGNCFYIASLCAANGIDGKVRYGHYTGDVHAESLFFKKYEALGFCQHGWIELSDGQVYDPTRWVFEAAEPYIYVGDEDDYDIGGSALRNAMRVDRTPPAFNPKEKSYEFVLPAEVMSILKCLCNDPRKENTFSIAQLFWIANEHFRYFGKYAKEIYFEFDRTGNGGMIPLDYWNFVMED